MAEYIVTAPDGKEITLEGPTGASQADIIAQAQKLYKPQARTGGTNISSDVPTVITAQNRGSVAPVEQPTTMADKLKALYEVPATIGSGMVSQPVSMAYGLGKGAVQDISQGKMPTAESRDINYRQAREATQFQPTSPASANVLESMGGALEAAKLQIDQAAKMATPAGDLAAATKIMKILDPGSVVRESELGMAMAATGVEDKVRNYANMVMTGEKLTPSQRKDFVELSDKLYNAAAGQFNQKRGEYAGIAQRNQLDVEAAVGAPAQVQNGWRIK
jgi:hypothetical protein